jgi:hypothetical protein
MTKDKRNRQLCCHLIALFGFHRAGVAGHLRVLRVTHWHRRLWGLIGRRPLHSHVGLWLQPCNAVHTFGMRFALTVVFLDRSDRCLKGVWQLSPNRVVACFGASSVVEFAAVERVGSKGRLG